MSLSLCKNRIVEIPQFGSIDLTIKNDIGDYRDYFLMAVRKNNPKRNFLFVSQLLGKHIPITPSCLSDACTHLVQKYASNRGIISTDENNRFVCKEQTLVIGFAETATAMGHAVYDNFAGNCYYVHTTRDRVECSEFAFEFEEEHCHATEQLFFLQKESWIREAKQIVIVDDEVTTGKTIRNIIEQIERYFPGKSYAVITFLDWRNEENLNHYKVLANKGLNVEFFSFVQGHINAITVANNTVEEEKLTHPIGYNAESEGWIFHNVGIDSTIISSAGNGIDCTQRNGIATIVDRITETIVPHLKGNKRALIGTGEFMYIPLQCGKQLPGENVFNATTRSPIIPAEEIEYGVKKSLRFVCPSDASRYEHVYNANIEGCDEVVLFFEHAIEKQELYSLLSQLDKVGYSYKHVVFVKEKK